MLDTIRAALTPETLAIVIIAFVLVFIVFLSVVANKITSLDSRIDDLHHSIKLSINERLTEINAVLQHDVGSARKHLHDDLAKMGDSMRAALNSTVADIQSEGINLKNQFGEHLANTSTQLASDIDSHTGDLTERIGQLRDAHSVEVSQYHKMLIGQINEHIQTSQSDMRESSARIASDISGKLDRQLHEGLTGIHDVFKGFASKIDEIAATRTRIDLLSADVRSLAALLDDRRARGAIGEVVIESLVRESLAPGDYELNARLNNGATADCLLKLPQPTGMVAITCRVDISDIELIARPLADKEEITSARRNFKRKLEDAINTAAATMIVPNQTAPSTVLLLPSETAFTEAHVHHRELIEDAHQRQVWLASPSTLIAMITIARTIIKDSSAQVNAEYLRDEINELKTRFSNLSMNLNAFGERVEKLNADIASARAISQGITQRFDGIVYELPHEKKNQAS